MKVLLVVGILLVFILFQVMNTKEGLDDDIIKQDKRLLQDIKDRTENGNAPLNELKVNMVDHDKLVNLINRYDNGGNNRKITAYLTVDQAKNKLDYRKSNNDN